jgi:hypothetical protein
MSLSFTPITSLQYPSVMVGWGSDDDEQEGDNAAKALTPITTSNNDDDSWAQEEPPDIQAQPMSANSFPRPFQSNTSGPPKGLEGFLSKALIRLFTLSMSNLRPQGCSPYFDKHYFKDSHIAGIGRDVAGDYYVIHRSGVRLFDKPWAKTWTPVSEEPINRLKRDQSAIYLTVSVQLYISFFKSDLSLPEHRQTAPSIIMTIFVKHCSPNA